MEATVWTEHIQTPQKLDFMIWPRLLGVIERSSHKAAWERNVTITEQLIGREADWKRFADIIGTKELRRLEDAGIYYYLPRPIVR